MNDLVPFAQANFRSNLRQFGIKADDRRRHVYIIGKSGVGKTTLMEYMLVNDIRAGRGVGLVDPHGDFAERILDFIPEERIGDVVYFNPADTEAPIGFNPLEAVGSEYRHLIASGIMGVFKKIWVDAWSARMEYILNNALLALLEYPGATILGVMRMLAEKGFREEIISRLEDPVVKGFWVNEFGSYSDRFATEAVAAIQNKVGQFISNPLVRNIIGQPKSAFSIRDVMDDGKIFIANLAKGRIGEDNSALLGAMLITKIQQAAMTRVDQKEENRRDFYLYIDEFQNFSTESFAAILSEARKYRLCLTLAHQYLEQLDERTRAAVIGNVGTIVCFRVGANDAEFLESEFAPEFEANDLLNLEKYKIYVKLLIDGIASRPFSAETLRVAMPETSGDMSGAIVTASRTAYGTPQSVVEKRIAEAWMGGEKIEEKAQRRNEQPLDRLLKPKDRKPVVIEDLRKALSRALAPEKQRPQEEGEGGSSNEKTG